MDTEDALTLVVDGMKEFYADIRKHKLDKCWKIRPLLDGRAIIKALDLPRGPAVGIYLQEQVRWMLLHPNGSKVDCMQHLQDMRNRDVENENKS